MDTQFLSSSDIEPQIEQLTNGVLQDDDVRFVAGANIGVWLQRLCPCVIVFTNGVC